MRMVRRPLLANWAPVSASPVRSSAITRHRGLGGFIEGPILLTISWGGRTSPRWIRLRHSLSKGSGEEGNHPFEIFGCIDAEGFVIDGGDLDSVTVFEDSQLLQLLKVLQGSWAHLRILKKEPPPEDVNADVLEGLCWERFLRSHGEGAEPAHLRVAGERDRGT